MPQVPTLAPGAPGSPGERARRTAMQMVAGGQTLLRFYLGHLSVSQGGPSQGMACPPTYRYSDVSLRGILV